MLYRRVPVKLKKEEDLLKETILNSIASFKKTHYDCFIIFSLEYLFQHASANSVRTIVPSSN